VSTRLSDIEYSFKLSIPTEDGKSSFSNKQISERGRMADAAKKMKVLNMEDKVNVIKHIESGKKKCDVFQEPGLFTSTVQTM
jgi:hypothetical protein